MKKGFTLSEVLITLVIIGIVSVLTIPAVMKNYRNRLYVAQMKKMQAQIGDAAIAMMNDQNVSQFKETVISQTCATATSAPDKCTTGVQYFLNNYLKTIKTNCARGTTYPCVATVQYKHQNGENATYMPTYTATYCVLTVTGQAVCGTFNPSNNCLSLVMDVNGASEPNTIGRDVFSIDVRQDGSIADWGSGCSVESEGSDESNCDNSTKDASIYQMSEGCYNKVKNAGWVMNY